MTNNEIRITIAELCGWKRVTSPHEKNGMLVSNNTADKTVWVHDKESAPHLSPPDYLNDLNAIHSALSVKSKEFRNQFDIQMHNYCSGRGILWCEADAKDYAIMFLFCLNTKRYLAETKRHE